MFKRAISAFCISLIVLSNLFFPSTSIGQVKTEEVNIAKRNDIRKLLIMTGAKERSEYMLSYMINNFKKIMPQVPEKFWDEFKNRADLNELAELILPIYDKYFTHEEIKSLIEFYESPIEKKLLSVQPNIMQESTLVGEKWGAKLGEQIGRELDEAGYKLDGF